MLACFLALTLIGCARPAAQAPPATARPLFFDAGPAGGATAEGYTTLAPADRYDPATGYGWTDPPDRAFTHRGLARSRTAVTGDGVQGRRLGFRADVPAGVWWITFRMEAGREDSATVALRVNGIDRPLGWHAFLPPAEPRTALQKIYRLYHGRAVAGPDGLAFTLTAGADTVRLLDLAVHPDPVPPSPKARLFLTRVEAAGGYGPDLALDRLLADGGADLDALLDEAAPGARRGDPFWSYWHTQLGHLAEAERHLRGMGWDSVRAATGLSIFDRYHQAVMLFDGLLGRSDTPLYERARFQRGRLLYWLGKERHGPNEIARGAEDLAALADRHPADTLLAMYTGSRIDTPDACDALLPTPGAPGWSMKQREALCRLGAEAAWWVRERQAANGELGGKLGDDVELLRWWPPLVLAGDTTALRGWRRLADGVWHSPHVVDGYAAEAADVEHASEFIADTAPEMALFSDDPVYTHRLRPSARYFAGHWTGPTPAGGRLFRSSWFGAEAIDTRPPRNRDVPMNTRAVKAVRYLAWKTGDPEVVRALHEWARTWAQAAARTDKGKPAGVVPPSLRYPDAAVNGDAPTWYRADMFWDYYDWDHSTGAKMLDQLVFTSMLTGNDSLLAPLTAALDLIAAHEHASLAAPAGSPAWAARHLRDDGTFWSVVEAWRLGTGDTRYDALLKRYGTPYLRYRLTGDDTLLEAGLDELLDAVRWNTPLRTTEVLHTDRVRTPGANHLKAMLAGSGIAEGMSPYYAVSWTDTGAGFTALVAESTARRLRVDMFSHADAEHTATMRLWRLAPGRYRITRTTAGHTDATTDELVVDRPGRRVPITLPPRTLVTMTIEE